MALEQRVRFHTEVNLSNAHIANAEADFLHWVSSLIPRDKFQVFSKLYTYPVLTTSIVEDVYFELGRVFDSRNASSTYQFTKPEYLEDWIEFRQTKLQADTIWRVTGWNKMKTAFNSVLIVDMPDTTGDTTEPYFYWLGVDKIFDYKIGPDGATLEWLLFKQDDNRLAVFDETNLSIYQCDEGYSEVIGLISSTAHMLGYCPARFFWTDTISSQEPDLRRNPIVKELSNLDWLLFFSTSKRHLDLYAPYPIYSAYETSCDFEDSVNGTHCDHGFLRSQSGEYMLLRDGSVEECPLCKNKHLAGPGTLLEIPAPDRESDMRNPIQITTIDEASLTYNTKETVRLEALIKERLLGQDQTNDASNREAVNELQVKANFESKTSVLNKLKLNFEAAQTFVEETICRLRYGSNFIKLSINYGTEFYIHSLQELYEKYTEAKKTGFMLSELDLLQDQILEMEHKNNTLTLQRVLLLKQIEPFRHSTIAEVIDYHSKGLASLEEVLVKLHFDTYIDRFERENTNVIDFGASDSLENKIKTIKNKIYDYAREQSKTLKSVNEPARDPGEGKNDGGTADTAADSRNPQKSENV